MVALQLSNGFRVAYAGLIDTSLAGLLLSGDTALLHVPSVPSESRATKSLGQKLLTELERNEYDCVVVPLEDFAYFACTRKFTNLRVLGCLLGGDTRVIAEVDLARKSSETRHLGAASPACALMRFDDLSCANDFEFSCISSWVPHDRLMAETHLHNFDFLELNSFWEGLLGLKLGTLKRTFKMQDYGVPCSRSHLLVINSRNKSSCRAVLMGLRARLLETYDGILSDADCAAEKLVGQFGAKFGAGLSAVRASVRVLSPHIEATYKSRLSLDWRELQAFHRWFHAKIAHSPEQWGVVSSVQLEHLVCDF